jgi:hypothetical protein
MGPADLELSLQTFEADGELSVLQVILSTVNIACVMLVAESGSQESKKVAAININDMLTPHLSYPHLAYR